MNTSEIMQKLSAFQMEERVTFTDIQRITGPNYCLGDQAFRSDPRAQELCEKIPIPYIKVLFTIQSSPNSQIHAEIFLPETGWSGALVFVGNGGLGSTLRELRCIPFLYGKHVVAHCDLATYSGYDSGLHNASVWADFGWRATHLTTVVAKQIAWLVYGCAPRHSYCSGSSTGGQQCISAASCFPEDFDGILARAPGISKLFLHLYSVWNLKHMTRKDGSCRFTAGELEQVSAVAKRYLKAKYSPGAPEGEFILTKSYFSDEDRENVLNEAREAGIPVIVADRKLKLDDPSLVAGFIGPDHLEEGRQAARFLLAKYTGHPGPLQIFELRGTDGSSVCEDRAAGFREVLAEDSRFHIVYSETGDFLRSKGREVVENFLTASGGFEFAGRPVDILFSHNDGMTLGALEVLENAGLCPGKDITVVSVDAEQAAINALRAGKINCVVECNPNLGPDVLALAERLVHGESISYFNSTPERTFSEFDDLRSIQPRGY